MNDCCKQRKNVTCIGAKDPTKEMICRECKTVWQELVNPDAGPALLRACKIAVMRLSLNDRKGEEFPFIDGLQAAVNKAEGRI